MPFLGRSPLTSIQDSICQIQRPHFCVLRNFEWLEPQVSSPFDISKLRGEFVGLVCTFDQARRLVPQPKYPTDAAQQDRFCKRFGWDVVALSDGSMMEHIPRFGFDNDPLSELRSSDRELFGETYTIFWLCPADPEVIASTLSEHMQSESRPYTLQSFLEKHRVKNPYMRSCGIMEGDLLLYVRQCYFDRMCLWATNASERSNREIFEAARDRFVKLDGRSAVDWDRLDELR